MTTVSLSTLLIGLREYGDELAERLEKLDRTRAIVAADLEAVEAALFSLTPNRAAAASAVPSTSKTMQVEAPARRGRGVLSEAVTDALLGASVPLSTAEIVRTLPNATKSAPGIGQKVSAVLSRLKQIGEIEAIAAEKGNTLLWSLK